MSTIEKMEVTTTQLFSLNVLNELLNNDDGMVADEQKQKLRAIKKCRRKGVNHGEIAAVYSLSKRSRIATTLGMGRLYASNTDVGTLQSEVRSSLCGEYYHDIDIVNSQPTLLCQFAKQLDMELPWLEHYVANRSEVLNKISSNRAEAKGEVINVIFGSKPKEGSCEQLVGIHQELKKFTIALTNKPEYADLWSIARDHKDGSKYGCFLAHLIQTEERNVMLAMKREFEATGASVDVLIHDGFMIRKRSGVEINSELLGAISDKVATATGYRVELIEKPMVGFDLPDRTDEFEEEYRTIRAQFEKDHFHYRPGNTVMKITPDETFRWSPSDAKDVLNTVLLSSTNKDGARDVFIKKWLVDPDRRLVDKLVYKFPEDVLPGEATIFTGFKYKQLEESGIIPLSSAIPLFEDLLSCMCGDQLPVTNYVRKTFAHIIQRPFEISGVCIIFSSRTQGTGKDTLMGILKKVVGNHTAHYTSNEAFWGAYDTQQEGALVMYLEEAGASLNKTKSGDLKARITTESIRINPKCIRAYNVPSFARYFMTTNEPDPVKFEMTDRRYLLINPSTRLVKTNWSQIYAIIKRPEFLVAIGKYLETVDITDFNSRDFPSTEIRDEIMELSASGTEAFLRDWNENRSLPNKLKPDQIYAVYKEWCEESGVDHKLTKHVFWKSCTQFERVYYTKSKDRVGATYNRMKMESEPE